MSTGVEEQEEQAKERYDLPEQPVVNFQVAKFVPVDGISAVSQELVVLSAFPSRENASHEYGIALSKDAMKLGPCPLIAHFRFQEGSVKEVGVNGISDEALLTIVLDRLRGFNDGPSRCRENSLAITDIESAINWLVRRDIDRQRRGVEGIDTPSEVTS